jgi:two-component system, chemotaxis family, CheB/CheR fusion protein
MNTPSLLHRNGSHPNGTEDGAAVTNESGSPRDLSPSSAATSLPPTNNSNLADSPNTLQMEDLAALDDRMEGIEGSRDLDQAYGSLLWGPWNAEASVSTRTLAESVLQNVRGPLVVLDADLRVRVANRAFCQTFQIAPDHIEGRWFPELSVSNQNVAQLRAFLDQILAQDGQIEELEVEYAVPMTGPRTMAIHGQRLAGSAAEDTLILLEIEDVTERAATERDRRELIVMAVHELRNPLTAIKGYAQMMRARTGTSEKALSIILEQAHHLSRLVDDLLASSGPGIAHPRLELRLMDLVSLARVSVEQAQLLGPGHLIRLEVPEERLEGFWDAGRLGQVFANLLGNAVKYSPAGGEIVVSVQALGSMVKVCIEDHGTGIAADALSRIFDQFYRIAATANSVPGLGLGLHVSKTLVEAHGGSISVQSVPGVGSTFAFELPRVAPTPGTQSDRLQETVR